MLVPARCATPSKVNSGDTGATGSTGDAGNTSTTTGGNSGWAGNGGNADVIASSWNTVAHTPHTV
ncbi:hypothetical protein M8542_49590 [Amycolatopsis sp. OK19-0408]|uniref:Uncharacterized protein n=1 Tax=Amycolatopsis iheyensis TaxID=2945988 RepID=A0A9X2NML0_9PSEU|nr:hypothetical protein [Amycolatopsis iheyensis]MCR6490858.1 hypothetical protein [Amycolatopsis iheyensis]